MDKTKTQLLNIYWEAFRQEARKCLLEIRVGMALKSTEAYKEIVNKFEDQANPVDPEVDGDFSSGDFPMLKKFFGDAAQVV